MPHVLCNCALILPVLYCEYCCSYTVQWCARVYVVQTYVPAAVVPHGKRGAEHISTIRCTTRWAVLYCSASHVVPDDPVSIRRCRLLPWWVSSIIVVPEGTRGSDRSSNWWEYERLVLWPKVLQWENKHRRRENGPVISCLKIIW